jgi:hypothetical protein
VKSRDPAALVDDLEQRLRSALVIDATNLREGVDMSPEAITHRLMELAEMSSLCLELAARERSEEPPR